jgi:hypothetical protein
MRIAAQDLEAADPFLFQKKKNQDNNQFSVQHMKSIWLTAFVQVSETAK